MIADGYTPERAAQLAPLEPIFVEAARRVDPQDLAGLVRVTVDALDGDGGAANDATEYDRNRFHASRVGGRVKTDGSHDAESGEIIMTALDAVQATLRLPGDTRKRSAKQADALVEICRRSLAHEHTKTPSRRRRGRPHLSVVVDLRDHEAEHPDLVADIRAEAEHVGRLSRTTLERLSCDCEISWIITDGSSEIIDVGRRTRNIPFKLSKALVVRDRHCQEPGCERPRRLRSPPHLRLGTRRRTNLDNLELGCWQHHRERHLREAQTRAPDG